MKNAPHDIKRESDSTEENMKDYIVTPFVNLQHTHLKSACLKYAQISHCIRKFIYNVMTYDGWKRYDPKTKEETTPLIETEDKKTDNKVVTNLANHTLVASNSTHHFHFFSIVFYSSALIC